MFHSKLQNFGCFSDVKIAKNLMFYETKIGILLQKKKWKNQVLV